MSVIARRMMRYLLLYKIQKRGFKLSTVGFVKGSQLFENLVPAITHQNQVLVRFPAPWGFPTVFSGIHSWCHLWPCWSLVSFAYCTEQENKTFISLCLHQYLLPWQVWVMPGGHPSFIQKTFSRLNLSSLKCETFRYPLKGKDKHIPNFVFLLQLKFVLKILKILVWSSLFMFMSS